MLGYARLWWVVCGFGWLWVVVMLGGEKKGDNTILKCRLSPFSGGCGGFFVLGGITIPEKHQNRCTVNFSRVGQPMKRPMEREMKRQIKNPNRLGWGCFVVWSFGL